MKFKILHTCIRVFDLEKSLEFYQKALGLKESRRLDNPEKKFTLVYLIDDETTHEIELTFNYDQPEPYVIGTGYSHIALEVEDLEKSHEYHTSLGYTCTNIYSVTDKPANIYFVTDPDGYKVEIIRKKA
ncbi:MAG: VOC family protein [Lachnospirales bacterium]